MAQDARVEEAPDDHLEHALEIADRLADELTREIAPRVVGLRAPLARELAHRLDLPQDLRGRRDAVLLDAPRALAAPPEVSEGEELEGHHHRHRAAGRDEEAARRLRVHLVQVGADPDDLAEHLVREADEILAELVGVAVEPVLQHTRRRPIEVLVVLSHHRGEHAVPDDVAKRGFGALLEGELGELEHLDEHVADP